MIKVPDTYRIDEPYPEIKNANYDPQTVAILQNLYSSIKSEMTATCNYSYQHFITVRFNENIAEAFLQIGIVEMNHMDLLAEAIIEFGGNPLFADNKGTFFSGQWVNYSTNIVSILEADIRDELEAVKAYTQASEMVTNESLSALLKRIAKDEALHAEILSDLLKQIHFWVK